MLRNLLNPIYNSIIVSWKASKTLFMLRFIVQILMGILPIALLYLIKVLIDKLSSAYISDLGFNPSDYFILIIIVFAIGFFIKCLDLLNAYFSELHTDKIMKFIEISIISKVKSLDISFFDSPDFYNELLNISTDSYSLQYLVWLCMDLLKSLVQLGASFIILVKLNIWMPFVISILYIPYFFISKYNIIKKYNFTRDEAPGFRRRTYISYIFKNRETAKEMRVFNYSNVLLDWFKDSWKEWNDKKKKVIKRETITSALGILIPEIGKVTLWVFVIIRILTKELTIGDFSFYTGLISQLGAGIGGIAITIGNIARDENKFINYDKFMKWKSLLDDKGSLELNEVYKIEFKNVCFSYPNTEKNILHNISFAIDQKQKIAFVGKNGAGKTTILNLILRLYDVNSGQILINNIDIRKYSLDSLRKQFSVLVQDYPHYALTFKQNIAISDWDRKDRDNEVIKVCEEIGLDSIIKKLPNGINSHITRRFSKENGVELSFGEKQKIALARAFYRKSSVVILDEPSAALDALAEREIFNIIHKKSTNKIALYVSHRLSNVVKADKIFVLSDGRLVEQGNHNSLIKKCGLYHDLFMAQAERYGVKKNA